MAICTGRRCGAPHCTCLPSYSGHRFHGRAHAQTITLDSFHSYGLAPAYPSLKPICYPFFSRSDRPPCSTANPNVSQCVAIAGFAYGANANSSCVRRGFRGAEPFGLWSTRGGSIMSACGSCRRFSCRLHQASRICRCRRVFSRSCAHQSAVPFTPAIT